ncbi:Maltose-binding periplasmic proteins/domains [uncultured Roseburia sp.]|uniref:Sugar ABC transporter substrate-binding protein n=2 Tax=Brotonthovivens ammoniilytica TaxID=2981725 RepID=A0ABT2TJS3_9FIRM|nr:sugar ABC transporter substrate-binding protein [Brotonthovivens ammoniilytica]MCU6761774.1 sugar ABC transporter substrate-binding protein [Brotonthovivens ammoniilytica]SCI46182.1 Maltose-binding periplasmic proteins/domains [uncultured Roseburia sp.]
MKLSTLMKRGLAVGLVGAMAVGLVACGDKKDDANQSSANSDKAAASDVTLKFQQWWGVELPDGALDEICKGFTDETGIKIQLLSNPYADTKDQISNGAATKTMADVVGLDGAWVYDFAKQGAIANLTELMKADNYDTSQLGAEVQVDGATYMIPVANFPYPMFVNMDILEEAGIKEIPKTWTEFTAACKAITEKTDAAGWIIGLNEATPSGIQNCFMSWLWASGGSMLDESGKPALTDNDGLTKTTEYVKSLFDNGYVAEGTASKKESDMVQDFINGRVAFMFDSLAHCTMIREENPDLNAQVAKVPVMDDFNGTSGMDVANWGIGIAANSEYQKEAMQFVEYLLSPEVNAQLVELANAFPGNVNAKPDYSKTDELFQQCYELYQECTPINEFTGIPTSEELMKQFNQQFQLYLSGDTKTADDMLKATQDLWMPAFE